MVASCKDGVVTAQQIVSGKSVPFEDADIDGKHVLVDVPSDELLQTLTHYRHNKV